MTRITHRLFGLAATALLAFAPALATTVTFRQGENGYAGSQDTFIHQNPASAGTNNGAQPLLGWDGDDPAGTGYDQATLIRFDGVFGSGAGQVPWGSSITSATLIYTVSDVGDQGQLHPVLVDWTDAATWNSFCAGGCSEGIQYGPGDGFATAAALGSQSADVTPQVQAWSDGLSANRGWIVLPTGTGGVDVRSAQHGTVAERPQLRIVYGEGPPVSNLLREPYLQLGTPTTMTVVWRTDTSTDSRVRFGTVFGTYDRQAVNATVGTDHYVTITGLSPSTRYYYTVGSTTTQQGGGTAEHYFTTSPPAGTAVPFTFWIFGDSGICSPVQNQVRDSMLAYTGADRPELFLHAGDVAQVSGADSEYTDCHLAYYKDILRHTPFWPAMGNHDSYSTTCQDPGPCSGPYFSTFVLPTAAEAGGAPSGTEAYYSYDYGNAHFVVLNGANVSRASNGPMANWLRTDLAATDQQWVIAYWHQPPYTKGTHDSDVESDMIQMRENILPILEQYGVDLVLNGHSHGYERSYLVDGAYATPTPTFSTLQSQGHIVDAGTGRPGSEYRKNPGMNPHEGTVYAVVATGGQPPGGPHGHPVMYYAESINGSALVDVEATTLTLTFLRTDGSVRDTVVIVKGDLPPKVQTTDPPKGSVLTALPSVTVTFNMDVTGVDAGDLTVNGSLATTVTPISSATYRFEGYAAPGQGTVSVVLAADGIAAADNPANLFAGDSWTYTIDLTPPRVTSTAPAKGAVIGALPSVTVTFSKPVFNVLPADLTVNGSPATNLSGNDGTPGPYVFTGYAAPADGLVDLQLLAGGIVDAQGQPFAGDSWAYLLTRRLVINEFLASNNTAAHDEYGEFDDYLEIYNPTDAPVDMTGMFLTDDLDSKSQYRIPAGVVVPPRGHVVFWCDGQTSQGALHTNFSILRAGEDLGLFDTDENGLAAIDTLTFGTQTTDVASGRFPDGQDGFVTMPVTPGAANTISCTGDGDCASLGDACNLGRCVNNLCEAVPTNEGGACDDGIACTVSTTCAAGVCNGGADDCPAGQFCDRSIGICEDVQVDPLPIEVGETWSYFKGTAEPTPADLTAWTRTDFDSAAWLSGPSGFGYGEDCVAQRGTTLTDMLNGYTSLYLRKPFRIDDPARVTSLSLTVDYDDAYVAYLNGTEVTRSATMGGTPGVPPAYNYALTAGTNHECSVCVAGGCNPAGTVDLSAFADLLVPGENVLAVHAFNVNLASSDFTVTPTMTSTENTGCQFDSECNDGNPCTDDTCNLNTGVCSHANDDTNACTDAVSCTTDRCSAGACLSTDACTSGLVCNHTTGTCESGPVTVTFRQGVDGYVGTQDTHIQENTPGTNYGATAVVKWDTDEPSGSGMDSYGLLRFDGIFGSGAGQIPPGSTIGSADLTLFVTNITTGPAATLDESAVDWTASTATWSNFGGEAGVQADEYGALAATVPLGTLNTATTLDVTGSLQRWAAGTVPNYGWLVRPNATDGQEVSSSEATTVANRPLLTVTFTAPAQGCTLDEECDDGVFCNGLERCVNLVCLAGTTPACDDGIACTVDSCDTGTDACTHTADSGACTDGDPCTDDLCNPASGCEWVDNTAPCSDGDACTAGDVCSGGVCTPGGPLSCDDAVACTDDACNALTGCSHVSNCTGGLTCNLTSGICESGPQTLTFQQGVGGYTGARDTYIDAALPSQAAAVLIVADGSPVEQILVRFDGIFGSGAGQIPQGSTISSATLTLRVGAATNDPSPNPMNVHRLLNPWADTDVWAAFGQPPWNATGGIQADGVDALAVPEATVTMNTASTAYPVDVTGSVQAWSANTSSNHGWTILTTSADGLRLESSESATASYRPRLSVTFTPPVTACTSNEQCDDGLWCTGTETCDLGTSTCVAGTPPDCADVVACTTDSCDEATDSCAHAPNAAACGDGNVCTDDACDLLLGCQNTPNTASCSDGNACTTGDLCSGGVCAPGGPLSCDDAVPCTDDSCNASTGCAHVSNCPGGQTCNLGTGICEDITASPLPILVGDPWRYFKGSTAPPADWTAIPFADGAWLEGPSGFGYGTDCQASHGTVLSDMSGGYISVYLRKSFHVDDPLAIASLILTVDYDDAFVAYINGTEVARRNVTGTPPSNTQAATADHECSQCNSTCNPAENIDITAYAGSLVAGNNVLAIQAHNVTSASTDFTITPSMSALTAECLVNDDCDDNNVCNGAETCDAGLCQAGTALDCSDANACTTDSCDPVGGCGHVPAPVGSACADGDACNGSETCDGAGACTAGTPPTCDDGVACTGDSCDPATGCVNLDDCSVGEVCNHVSGICESGPVTVTFQDGASGYAGTVDTYLVKGTPTVNHALATTLVVDGSPDASISQILLRFGQLFASEGGPIPDGAQIDSASLTFRVTNGSLDGAELHRMLVDWTDTATWSSLVNGVQTDGSEAATAVDVSGFYNAPIPALHTLNVTSSLAAWAGGQPNRGWVWVSPPGGTDSWQYDSSEGATPPTLSVTYRYTPPIQGRISCTLDRATAAPGGTADLTATLENLGSLPGVRGYQTQLVLTRTSVSGTLSVDGPGGITVDDSRPDYLFYGYSEDYPVTNCGLLRASSSLLSGAVVVGSPAYLSGAVLDVSPDAAPGSTFEVTFAPYPDTSLADAQSDPIPYETGPACVLTVGSCGSNSQCDDGNPCTADVCDSGVCQSTPEPGLACDDGDSCTTDDTCTAGGTCQGGAPLSCDDGNACTTDGCSPATGCAFTPAVGQSCEDGNACTTGDACDGAGTCQGGTPATCDDGNACTADTCDPGTGCVSTPTPGAACDDGNACTSLDTCDGAGTCVGGAPLDCNDNNACTSDACESGACVHAPSGACGISGTVRYYRESGGTEPSLKPAPNVGINVVETPVSPDATTGSSGSYSIPSLGGVVTVGTLPKLGSPRAAEHNDAISSFDAVQIARHAVGEITLSDNQQLAGDVSGNGSVSSFDAAQVAQFAVEVIDHFDVATANGSDWKFLRCDTYNSAQDQNCTDALYQHAPLAGPVVDDFHAVLYGEVTGNWQAAAGFARAASEESLAADEDRRTAAELRSEGVRIPARAAGAAPAVLSLPSGLRLRPGSTVEVPLLLSGADGIQALDLRLAYDPARVRILSVRAGDLASSFKVAEHDRGGDLRVGMYGVLPLQGSGTVLIVTLEITGSAPTAVPFAAEASANEGRIPLLVRTSPRGAAHRRVPGRED